MKPDTVIKHETVTRRALMKFIALFGAGAAVAPVIGAPAFARGGKYPQMALVYDPPAQTRKPTLTYRTRGEWGEGAGRALSPEEVDLNFWQIEKCLRGMRA